MGATSSFAAACGARRIQVSRLLTARRCRQAHGAACRQAPAAFFLDCVAGCVLDAYLDLISWLEGRDRVCPDRGPRNSPETTNFCQTDRSSASDPIPLLSYPGFTVVRLNGGPTRGSYLCQVIDVRSWTGHIRPVAPDTGVRSAYIEMPARDQHCPERHGDPDERRAYHN